MEGVMGRECQTTKGSEQYNEELSKNSRSEAEMASTKRRLPYGNDIRVLVLSMMESDFLCF
jgi:hypothetical protein